jgi:glycerol kinase
MGAAFLAGLAVGYWNSVDQLNNMWQSESSFEPAANRELVVRYLHFWQKAVERSKNWME